MTNKQTNIQTYKHTNNTNIQSQYLHIHPEAYIYIACQQNPHEVSRGLLQHAAHCTISALQESCVYQARPCPMAVTDA